MQLKIYFIHFPRQYELILEVMSHDVMYIFINQDFLSEYPHVSITNEDQK